MDGACMARARAHARGVLMSACTLRVWLLAASVRAGVHAGAISKHACVALLLVYLRVQCCNNVAYVRANSPLLHGQ